MHFYHLFTFHLVDLREFLILKEDPHTKKSVGTLDSD